ncbi:unnamed protein product [[Candida] boidinii]|nr:unnamed protein product [[Candida] boidinii]
MKVKIGDESADEDVLNIIQAIGYSLCSSLKIRDPRASIAYFMVLIYWLCEDFEAVDLFLQDPSILDQLLAYLVESQQEDGMIQGLISVLLGIVYEFSKKTSPVPRLQLHSILNNRIGVRSYHLKIHQFKNCTEVKTFDPDAILNPEKDDTGLPKVYFDSIFIQLLKDNFYRIKSSLQRDPNIDPVHKFDYEAFEKVQDAYSDLNNSFIDYKKNSESVSTKNSEEIEKLTNDYNNLSAEYDKVKTDFEKLELESTEIKKDFELSSNNVQDLISTKAELEKQLAIFKTDLKNSKTKISTLETSNKQLTTSLETIKKEKQNAENGINKMSRELFQLTREKDTHEKKIKTLEKEAVQLNNNYTKLETSTLASIKEKENQIIILEKKMETLNQELKTSTDNYNKLRLSFDQNLEKLKNLEVSNSNLMEKLRSAAEIIERLQKEKTSSNNELVTFKQEAAKDISELKSQLQSIKDDKINLEKQNSELQSEIALINKSMESSNSETSKLKLQSEETIEDLKSQLEDLTEEYDALEEFNQALSQKLSDLEKEHELLKKENQKRLRT